MASIYDNRFCIPLDFEILESSLPLYQYGPGSRLMYELTFADQWRGGSEAAGEAARLMAPPLVILFLPLGLGRVLGTRVMS